MKQHTSKAYKVLILAFPFSRYQCRILGALAVMERVQCELWRGGEGACARLFTALRCARSAVHGNVEGAVSMLPGRLQRSVSTH